MFTDNFALTYTQKRATIMSDSKISKKATVIIMVFGGLQKLTLLDFPGVVACTLFTRGCNFLCPFCHNATLVNRLSESETISDTEVLSYLKKRIGILEGVCITGGEPLLHTELKDFIKEVKALGYKVKLDTNGSKPKYLKELVSEGLIDYVAMDIKNCFEKYRQTAGVDNLDLSDIEESIDFLMEGGIPYEFRTTVANGLHTVEDIERIAKRIAGADRYFIQNFLDSGNIIGAGLSPIAQDTIKKMCKVSKNYVKDCSNR